MGRETASAMWHWRALVLWTFAIRCAGVSCASAPLAPAFVTTLGTKGPLSPLNGVPKPLHLNASGSTVLTLTPQLPDAAGKQNYKVDFVLTQIGLDDIYDYHIHIGNASVNGPIALFFSSYSSSPLQTFNTIGSAQGTVSVPAGVVGPIIGNPGNYYVVIHTASHPDGACRAQLKLGSSLPYTYPSLPTYAYVLIAVGGGPVLLALLLTLLLKKKLPLDSFSLEVQALFVQPLSLGEVKKATRNFSHEMLLGEGGFGVVYKGIPPAKTSTRQPMAGLEGGEDGGEDGGGDGCLWAVKRAKSKSITGLAEFQTEVRVISQLSHCRLVRLVGFCNEGGEQILVYEFMPNGTLKEAIRHGVKSYAAGDSLRPLTFSERLSIALGSAQGLEYLHTFAKPAIIHRDVKSENILLDEVLEAKVADFGLLKSSTLDGNFEATRVAGTPGYMDPEYFTTYRVSSKSDVYSFGVVLLELLTGRAAIYISEDSDEHVVVALVGWAYSTLLPDADIATCMDPNLEAYDKFAAQLMFEKAKECISRESKNRPTMSEVVGFLNALRSDMERQVIGMQRSPSFSASSVPWLGPSIGDTHQTSSNTKKSASYNFVSEIMERGR